MTSSGTERTIPIHGVQVKFPCKPYPSQLTMMERIIKCINRKQNSLLESPTGSGKSLALLCSSLAWLMTEKEKIKQYMYQLELEELERSMRDEADSSCCSTPLNEEKVDNLPPEKMDNLPFEKSDRLSSEKIEASEKMDTSSLIPDIKDELLSEGQVQPVNHSDTACTTKSDCKDSGSKEEDVLDNIIKKNEFSDDADFQAPKKRFRTPGTQSLPTAKKQRPSSDEADDLTDFIKVDGDASKNPPEWTMKLTSNMKEECCTDNKKEMLIDNVKENKKDFGNETKKLDVSEFPIESAPQIFFGTRTHKQITQIVREMNKTEYKTTKMCILASREHTCIHPHVSKSKNKTEDCRKCVEGREGMSCGFYAKSRLIGDHHLQQYGITKAWDIEDLVGFGQQAKACPYYTCRELMKEADIIFCPYNYLIDPIIRSQMEIDLTDQIVILDEAHNIEDSSRDAASWCVTTNQLDDAMNDLDYFVAKNIFREQHEVLHAVAFRFRHELGRVVGLGSWEDWKRPSQIRKKALPRIVLALRVFLGCSVHLPQTTLSDSIKQKDACEDFTNDLGLRKKDIMEYFPIGARNENCANVRRWIVSKSEHLKDVEFEKCSKVWSGKELLKALEELGFTPKSLRTLKKHFNKIMSPKDQSNNKREHRPLRATTATLFEGLFMVLYFLLKENYKYLCDYRVAIIKKPEMTHTELPGGWRRKGAFKKQWVFTLHFWCQSPAVAFSEIGSSSRSVILTSGTLSPMSSFSSELGVSFPIQLEANHVIGPSQVWVSTLSVGPAGSALNATFRFTETYSFQDEVGEAIHNVCQVVPYGVLCFFPSYSMLDKLMQRWKITGLWARLSKLKRTFSEPRRGDKADFNDLMDYFYKVIKDSEESDDEAQISGALFLAVCRGKVSEGLDFADNNARAVITVGIPFPNFKDTQVELKRQYNNQYCSEKGLLNGSEWYEIQAYRALNQIYLDSLGR